MRFIVLFLCLLSGYANAHQFTPTYPKLTVSHIAGVYKTEMLLFNAREEIRYYSLNVFDEEWNPIKFATESKLIAMDYQERKYVNIYISKTDVKRAKYICSKSKILQSVRNPSIVASRICSKIK